MDIEEKMRLATRGAIEVLTREDLRNIFETIESPKGYIGVEPSGLFHIGWTIWVQKLIDLIEAGVDMTVLWATWHAFINEKLGGSLENIRKCAKYLEHCLFALGVNPDKINFLTAEDLMNDLRYWDFVIKSAKHMTLKRVKRAMTILGRKESEAELDFSKCIYPCLQVSDIFYSGFLICLAGLDQRRAHILAREIAPKLKLKKPVAIHMPLLIQLSGKGRMDVTGKGKREIEIDLKMSKSKPEEAIFIHDEPDDIRRKIDTAYCPPREIEYNPIIDISQKIVLRRLGSLVVDRPAKYGGPLDLHSNEELVRAYLKGDLHPSDLKNAVIETLSEIFRPVRGYFATNSKARKLLEEMKELEITR